MSQNYSYPSSSQVTISGIGDPIGIAVPSKAVYVAGKNPSGNLTGLSVDSAGNLLVSLSISSAEVNTNINQVGGVALSLGQKASAASIPVVIASDQSTLPISAASLPLPAGAATSALQTTGNSTLTTINTTLGSPFQAGGAISNTAFGISGSLPAGSNAIGSVSVSNFPATQPVSAVSLPLPTGAATSALQTTISGQLPATLGQKASAASLAVVLASDQSSVPTTVGGKSKSNAPVYNIYSSSPVTTTTYVQLVASTTSATNMIEIFDSSGQSMIIGVGASGSEVVQLYTLPGGNGQVPLAIPAGSRVAIKALTASATAGYLTINFYS